jgi:hypothetical protein
MAKRGIVIPLIILVVAALLFLVIDGKWTAWSGSRAEQETDDAYVRPNMTPSLDSLIAPNREVRLAARCAILKKPQFSDKDRILPG